MKVLVICILPPVLLPEADHAFHIVQHLADEGVTVDVLTSKGSVKSEHPNVTHFPVMEKWNWNESVRLAWVIKRSKADAVFLYYVPHLYEMHPMVTFAPSFARKLNPCASIVTLFSNYRGSEPNIISPRDRLIHRLLRRVLGKNTDWHFGTMLRDSSQIIALSRRHLRILAQSLPEVSEKSQLIPPPPIMPLSADTAEVRETGREQLGITSEMFLFAYFGYQYPGKGLETLVQAFYIVLEQHPLARLAFVGAVSPYIGGPEYAEKIQQLVTRLGLQEKVIFTGKFGWDSTQGSTYLRAADACVLPFDDGVQMNNSSLAGTVAHGLPIVTTAGPETEELFVDGQNVFLCPPKDPEAMAAAMLEVMNDSALRQHLRRGAACFAEDWFSWRSATQRTLAALKVAN